MVSLVVISIPVMPRCCYSIYNGAAILAYTTDGRTGKDDADLFPEDGSAVR